MKRRLISLFGDCVDCADSYSKNGSVRWRTCFHFTRAEPYDADGEPTANAKRSVLSRLQSFLCFVNVVRSFEGWPRQHTRQMGQVDLDSWTDGIHRCPHLVGGDEASITASQLVSESGKPTDHWDYTSKPLPRDHAAPPLWWQLHVQWVRRDRSICCNFWCVGIVCDQLHQILPPWSTHHHW